jgi:hypothetical protein
LSITRGAFLCKMDNLDNSVAGGSSGNTTGYAEKKHSSLRGVVCHATDLPSEQLQQERPSWKTTSFPSIHPFDRRAADPGRRLRAASSPGEQSSVK